MPAASPSFVTAIFPTNLAGSLGFLRLEARLMAHFLTCFLALLVYRILEKKLGGIYTCESSRRTWPGRWGSSAPLSFSRRRPSSRRLSEIREEKNCLFYKDCPYTTKKLHQRLIITYSPKYAAYQKEIRRRQVERAEKMVASGKRKAERKNPNDPARFVAVDKEREEACQEVGHEPGFKPHECRPGFEIRLHDAEAFLYPPPPFADPEYGGTVKNRIIALFLT
mgnify:CR=1 FL=1